MQFLIEMSGGVLREVYSKDGGEDVVVIDWDEIKEDDANYKPPTWVANAYEQMPEDTREVFSRA